jgi:hypothetical protein
MARLVYTPQEVIDLVQLKMTSGDFDKDWKRTEKGMKKVEKQYDILAFGVADGHALYGVYSYKPLQLFHIPYGDAYHVDPALIRGLTARDVRERVRGQKKMFGG